MGEIRSSKIYDPRITEIYSILLDVSGIFSLICFPFLIYVIMTQSKKLMNAYKWQLLYYVTVSYSLDLLLAVWKPVYLFPLGIGYSIGNENR